MQLAIAMVTWHVRINLKLDSNQAISILFIVNHVISRRWIDLWKQKLVLNAIIVSF
jgi:hypothetical protein